MLRSTLVLCTLLLPAAVLCGQEEAIKKEKAKLAGAWVVESMEMMGKKVESSVGDTFTFASDKVTLKTKVKEELETYKLDPSKKPREIDFKSKETILGIYELDGDTLKLCVSTSGKRPTAFDSNQGILGILKRAKK
jgi:uncharacterized protein (TIGR03067 family)